MNVDLEVEIEEFIRAKSIGALASTVLPSLGDTAHCVAWVYWENDYYLSSSSNEKLKGFAPSLHSSFGMCHSICRGQLLVIPMNAQIYIVKRNSSGGAHHMKMTRPPARTISISMLKPIQSMKTSALAL